MRGDETKTIDVNVMPRLDGIRTLYVLAALAEAGHDIAASGLLVEIGDDDWHRIFLQIGQESRRAREKRTGLRDDLLSALQEEGKVRSIERVASNRKPVAAELFPQALDAAVILTARSGSWQGARTNGGDVPFQEMMLIVRDPAAIPQKFAALLRLGRDVRLAASATDQGETAVVVKLDDSAEEYGMVSSMLGRGDLPANVIVLRPFSVGERPYWLPQSATAPATKALGALARVIVASQRPPGEELICIPTSERSADIIWLPPGKSAQPVGDVASETGEPLQPFDVKRYDFKSAEQANAELSRLISDPEIKLGYRISLRPVRRSISVDSDLDQLREQLAETQNLIDEVTALGAPQMRLMRFTDAQIPAMIDGLRKLPPAMTSNGTILYAAGHTTGRREPAHFLLYNPLVMPLNIPEAIWRADNDDRPITYWLEPYIAHALLEKPSRARIFVPNSHILVPSLAHFGGNIDETLKLVIGRKLYAGILDLFEDPQGEPMVLFTKRSGEGKPYDLEVIDRRDFAPLEQQIGWINDYLNVLGHSVLDRKSLSEVAEALYEGDFAQSRMAGLTQTVDALSEEWRAATDRVRDEGLRLVADYVSEIEAVQERIANAHAYLEQSDHAMKGLERLLSVAESALQRHFEAEAALTGMDGQMVSAREQFAERVASEITRGERAIERLEERVLRLRASLDRSFGGDR